MAPRAPETEQRWRTYVALGGSLLVLVATLAFDLLTPLGVASGVPYVGAILFALWSPYRYHALWTGAAGIGLTLAGWAVSGHALGDIDAWIVIVNRLLACFAIAVTAAGVTLYRREQDRLAHAQRALQRQEALARIGEMAAVIAHEVKNPLAGVGGSLQILQGRFPEGADERRVIRDMRARLDALRIRLEGLLDLARTPALQTQTVDLSQLVHDVVASLQHDPEAQAMRFELTGERLSSVVDPSRLREALLNLLLNAIEATGGEGTVRIHTRREGEVACIQVSDDGPGIPPHHRPRAVEPFFTTREHGTGLGLSVVRHTAEQHGGEMILEHPDQGGLSVHLHLPT